MFSRPKILLLLVLGTKGSGGWGQSDVKPVLLTLLIRDFSSKVGSFFAVIVLIESYSRNAWDHCLKTLPIIPGMYSTCIQLAVVPALGSHPWMVCSRCTARLSTT